MVDYAAHIRSRTRTPRDLARPRCHPWLRMWAAGAVALLCVAAPAQAALRQGWPKGYPPWGVSARTVLVIVKASDGRTLLSAPMPWKREAYYGPLLWSPDARFLAFNLQVEPRGKWRPAVWNMGKKTLKQLREGFFCWDISPKGDRMLGITADNKVVEVALDGSRERIISSGPLLGAKWSPDGRRLAAVRQSGGRVQLEVLTAGGRLIQVLQDWDLRSGGKGIGHCWSPDGKWIAFSRWERDKQAIFVVAARGGKARQVLEGAQPCWSPDGKHLAYCRQDAQYLSIALWIARVRDWQSRRLPLDTVQAEFPAWAHDGTRLATIVVKLVPLKIKDLIPPPGSR